MGGGSSKSAEELRIQRYTAKPGLQVGVCLSLTGLPVQNHKSIVKHLDNPDLARAPYTISKGGMEGVTVTKASASAQKLLETLPDALRNLPAVGNMEVCVKDHDWQGKANFADLKIDDHMHYLLWRYNGTNNNSSNNNNNNNNVVDFAYVHVMAPSGEEDAEKMFAKLLQSGLVCLTDQGLAIMASSQ